MRIDAHPDDKTRLQRQIDATDHEIDRLVYDLYSLTDEEIAIVEACGESFDKTQGKPGRTSVAVASAPAPCKNVPAWSLDTDTTTSASMSRIAVKVLDD